MAAASIAPTASADLNVRTFHAPEAYAGFHNGLGIYDPAATANLCWDLVSPCPGVQVRDPDEVPDYCLTIPTPPAAQARASPAVFQPAGAIFHSSRQRL